MIEGEESPFYYKLSKQTEDKLVPWIEITEPVYELQKQLNGFRDSPDSFYLIIDLVQLIDRSIFTYLQTIKYVDELCVPATDLSMQYLQDFDDHTGTILMRVLDRGENKTKKTKDDLDEIQSKLLKAQEISTKLYNNEKNEQIFELSGKIQNARNLLRHEDRMVADLLATVDAAKTVISFGSKKINETIRMYVNDLLTLCKEYNERHQ